MAAPDYLHPSLRNIAPDLEDRDFDLDALAQEVIEDYRRDKQSRSEWAKMHAYWIDLYYQKDKPVSRRRWQGSKESVPVLAEAATQFHSRAYSAMFANRRLVQAIPTGRSDKKIRERAERISTHMTWQLTVQNRNYRRDKDKMLLGCPIHGSVFTKTFWNPSTSQAFVQNVRAVDLMIPYGVGPRDIADIERKTEVIWISVNKTRLLKEAGWISCEGTPFSLQTEAMEAPDITVDKNTGTVSQPDETNKPCLFLESHRLVDFDGDGIAEPYIVTVDAESRKVVRIAIRYETDEAGNPIETDWYNFKKPVEYYTHYPFFENPDGFYGLGLGHLLGELNRAINKLLRQTVDAGTLANAGNMSGFISQALAGPAGGELEIELGKFIKIAASVDDISKGMFQFKFPGPNQALFNALQLLLSRADRLGTVTEAVTGQMDRVMQPTTVLALLEESQRLFSSVHERIVHSWGDELQKIYRLNRLHMNPVEMFSVLDISGSPVDQQVTRNDYADDMLIMPTVDPQMSTRKEQLTRAQMVYQTLMQNPIVMQSPPHMYNAAHQFLEAMQVDNIDDYLPNPAMMQPSQLVAISAAAQGFGKDWMGLRYGGNSQGDGGSGLPPGPDMGMGAAGNGSPLPGSGMEAGSDLGGAAPGAGAAGGGGLAQGPAVAPAGPAPIGPIPS